MVERFKSSTWQIMIGTGLHLEDLMALKRRTREVCHACTECEGMKEEEERSQRLRGRSLAVARLPIGTIVMGRLALTRYLFLVYSSPYLYLVHNTRAARRNQEKEPQVTALHSAATSSKVLRLLGDQRLGSPSRPFSSKASISVDAPILPANTTVVARGVFIALCHWTSCRLAILVDASRLSLAHLPLCRKPDP